jgi:hypothetical protein
LAQGALQRLAVVIPFPFHRVRRVRRMIDVFAPLREAVEFERTQSRFMWACTAATTVLSLALQLSIG